VSPAVVQILLMVGIPLLLGTGILRVIGISSRCDRLAFVGWSWITGSLATGAVMFIWLCLDPDFERFVFVQVLMIVAGSLLLYVGERIHPFADRPLEHDDAPRWERILFGAVVTFVLLLTAVRILVHDLMPVFEHDEGSFWSLKAKALFLSGGFGPAFRELVSFPNFSHNMDYPPLSPLLQVFVFAHAGEVTHVANRLPIQLCAPAVILVLASGLRRGVRPAIAAALLLVFSASSGLQNVALRAEGDLMVTLGFLVAFDAWIRWRRTDDGIWLRLCAIAVAFLLWSKHEGLLLTGAGLGALAIAALRAPRPALARLRPRTGHLWLLLPIAAIASTRILNSLNETSNWVTAGAEGESPFSILVASFVANTGEVLSFFANRVVFAPGHSGLVIPCLFLLVLAFPLRLWKSELRYPTLALLLAMAGYLLVFIGLLSEMARLLHLSAGRLAFHLVPSIILWIGAASGLLFPTLRSRWVNGPAPTAGSNSLQDG